MERDNLQRVKEGIVDEENIDSKMLQTLRLQVSETEKAFLTAQAAEKRQMELELRLSELATREETLIEERAVLSRNQASAERAAYEAEESLAADRNRLRADEGTLNGRIVTLRGDLDGITRAISTTDSQSRKVADRPASTAVQRDLDTLARTVAEKEDFLREYTPKISNLNSQISRQENLKRAVQENINYRTSCRERDSLIAEYKQKRTAALALDGQNSSSAEVGARYLSDRKRELQRAEQELQRLSDQRSHLVGRLTTLTEQTAEYETKLNGPQFRSIDERHRKKNIECETTMMAVHDLDTYFNALDRALLNFHTLKIREVNKIIKELWQLIYRGEDIDNIEIVSGVEAGDSGGGRADKSYNYRVVMRKGLSLVLYCD